MKHSTKLRKIADTYASDFYSGDQQQTARDSFYRGIAFGLGIVGSIKSKEYSEYMSYCMKCVNRGFTPKIYQIWKDSKSEPIRMTINIFPKFDW